MESSEGQRFLDYSTRMPRLDLHILTTGSLHLPFLKGPGFCMDFPLVPGPTLNDFLLFIRQDRMALSVLDNVIHIANLLKLRLLTGLVRNTFNAQAWEMSPKPKHLASSSGLLAPWWSLFS